MLKRIYQYLKKFFAKGAAAWSGVIEQHREIITEAAIADEKLMVRQDRIDPANYVGFYFGKTWVTIRKAEMAEWTLLPRSEQRRLVRQFETKLKKGILIYEEINGFKIITEPKKVLNPNNL